MHALITLRSYREKVTLYWYMSVAYLTYCDIISPGTQDSLQHLVTRNEMYMRRKKIIVNNKYITIDCITLLIYIY